MYAGVRARTGDDCRASFASPGGAVTTAGPGRPVRTRPTRTTPAVPAAYAAGSHPVTSRPGPERPRVGSARNWCAANGRTASRHTVLRGKRDRLVQGADSRRVDVLHHRQVA